MVYIKTCNVSVWDMGWGQSRFVPQRLLASKSSPFHTCKAHLNVEKTRSSITVGKHLRDDKDELRSD